MMDGLENARQLESFFVTFSDLIPENLTKIFELTNLTELEIAVNNLNKENREKTLLRVSDMSGMTKLKRLEINNYYYSWPYKISVDLDGIQNLSQLEYLSLTKIKAQIFKLLRN